MLWFFLALGGAFLVAVYFMELKRLIATMDSQVLAGTVFLGCGLLMLSISLMNGLPEIGELFIPAVGASVLINIAATLLYLRALKITDLSLAIPMIAFTPLFLIFTSSLILDEVSDPDGIIGIVLVVAGSYVLNLNSHHDILSPFEEMMKNKGLIYMLIVAVLFSFLANADKVVMLNSDYLLGPGTTLSIAGTLFLSYSLYKKQKIREQVKPNIHTIAFATAAICVATLLTYLSWSMQIVPYVIAIQRMSILFSVIFGGVLLHEKGIAKRLAGALLMVIGAALIVLSA